MTVDAPARSIVRVVLIVVAVAIVLYLMYLLRRPIGWLFAAGFVAVALSGPVNFLNRYIRRGVAIALVYLGLFLVPVLLGLLVVPPIVDEANALVDNLPEYARDAREFADENETLRNLEEDYNVIEKVEEEANKLPGRIDDAAVVLRDIGFGVVDSLFALITILILAAFLLGSGRHWIDAAISLGPPARAERLRVVLDHVAKAVGNYVAGALVQATIAGAAAYIVMTILGVPFREPLAVLTGLFSLIPLIGATIAAVLVGLVTVFTDFPTVTIVWVIWAVVYQQVENTLIQPQIQRRAVNLHPFAVLVAVLFGSTLLGVLGAIIAIPVAASVQIVIREWWEYRHEWGTAGRPRPPAAALPADAPP
jgi:predicted PurR-regulated permease PerM